MSCAEYVTQLKKIEPANKITCHRISAIVWSFYVLPIPGNERTFKIRFMPNFSSESDSPHIIVTTCNTHKYRHRHIYTYNIYTHTAELHVLKVSSKIYICVS